MHLSSLYSSYVCTTGRSDGSSEEDGNTEDFEIGKEE
jgi:hypothetical protein